MRYELADHKRAAIRPMLPNKPGWSSISPPDGSASSRRNRSLYQRYFR
jgi:hypothetical protein